MWFVQIFIYLSRDFLSFMYKKKEKHDLWYVFDDCVTSYAGKTGEKVCLHKVKCRLKLEIFS